LPDGLKPVSHVGEFILSAVLAIIAACGGWVFLIMGVGTNNKNGLLGSLGCWLMVFVFTHHVAVLLGLA
jgi:hypothetical protein